MSTAVLHFIEITIRLEPNTSSFSILASEDPHATHKAEYTASSVDGLPDQLLKDLMQQLIQVYPDPKGEGLAVQVRGDTIVGVPSAKDGNEPKTSSRRTARATGKAAKETSEEMS
jgi:hypothetical protein